MISRDTDEWRRQAASDHDVVVQLEWRSTRNNLVFYGIHDRQAQSDHDAVFQLESRSMRDNLVFYGIDEMKDENCDAVLAHFFTGELGVTKDIVLAMSSMTKYG